MRILFISDIHGLKTNLPKIEERFLELKCDYLVVLGDLYYIYSNLKDLKDYDREYVKNFLSAFGSRLICLRGNCDSFYDIIDSPFPITDDIKSLQTEKSKLYLTHGHLYNESNWHEPNSVLIFGHTHRPQITQVDSTLYINPGSISLPRNSGGATYLFYNEEEFIIYDLDDNVLKKEKVR